MSFQTALTIHKVLREIENAAYVLPSIQREFVWDTEQMLDLIDSLLLGYPIGSFLFWKVEEATSKSFRFYDFLNHHDARTGGHNPVHDVTTPRPFTAVLDGQQRLTSLNIAFRGDIAVKAKGKWHVSVPWEPPFVADYA